ncbi:MAG: hypothetical protein AAGG06_05880 [Pseudomonadota bacterium]
MTLTVSTDLGTARQNAARAEAMLHRLRAAYDLSQYEFTKAVRIAPGEIPHSHPVLTLSTAWIGDADRFLAMYLHEQMHWYLTDHRSAALEETMAPLRHRYPDVPSPASQRARDEASIYLHLVVNLLEIVAVESLIGADRARPIFETPPVYPWIYATVLAAREDITALLIDTEILPIPDARQSFGKLR